jgi:hypothetical protein
VFLSASVPTRKGYRRPSEAPFEVEQAVVSLGRAVLAEDGRLVFGGHPSISPLVASVAAEYIRPVIDAPRILIYQSRAFEHVLPDETWEMHQLGYARLVWTPAERGERFDPSVKTEQCLTSLAAMRRALLNDTDPIAMVAIGGMEGVEREAALFRSHAGAARDRRRAVYVVKTTGGAAEKIAAASPADDNVPIYVLEDRWAQATGLAHRTLGTSEHDREQQTFTPYPALMQWFAKEISARNHA